MSKILTLSIAAYNVEEYIATALDSCVIPNMDALEVIIVDDGATDSTADIAHEYCQRYPETFRLIRKENGGYGSTVNTAIDLAEGTYFKLLDGDDWFDSEALTAAIDILSKRDVDIFISPFVECEEDSRHLVDQCEPIPEGYFSFHELDVPWRLSMHSLCYRTDILRQSGLRLTQHCFYTDTEYNTQPLPLVNTAYVSHRPLYQYRVGREGQSTALAGLIKHRHDMTTVVKHMHETYHQLDDTQTTAARVIKAWIIDVSISQFHTLFRMPMSAHTWKEIEDFRRIAFADPELHDAIVRHSEWARLYASANRFTYPLISQAFTLYKRFR